MDAEDLIKGFEPVLKMSVDAHLLSKAILKHYVKTIGEITGKPKEDIYAEINKIVIEVKEETEKQLQNIIKKKV